VLGTLTLVAAEPNPSCLTEIGANALQLGCKIVTGAGASAVLVP